MCCQKCPDWIWDTISFLFNEQRGCQSEVKWTEFEVKHSPPSIAEDEKEWSCTRTVPILLQDVVRNAFGDTQFTQKIQQETIIYQNFISYLYEAQHVSGDTPPIIGSLKLHEQPLVFHTWRVVGRVVAGRCPATTRPTTLHVCKTRGC